MRTIGLWLLTFALTTSSAIPAALAPSLTSKGDAARSAIYLPLLAGRGPSRALPHQQNLRELSQQTETPAQGSIGRVSRASSRRMSHSAGHNFPFAAVASPPLALLCRLRI